MMAWAVERISGSTISWMVETELGHSNDQKKAYRLAEWMAVNFPEGLTVIAFPTAYWRLIHITYGVEQLHREFRRQARVVSIFPNPISCLRLVSVVLAEISDEWLTGRTIIAFQGSE